MRHQPRGGFKDKAQHSSLGTTARRKTVNTYQFSAYRKKTQQFCLIGKYQSKMTFSLPFYLSGSLQSVTPRWTGRVSGLCRHSIPRTSLESHSPAYKWFRMVSAMFSAFPSSYLCLVQTCSPNCKLRVMDLRAFTIWALIAEGFSCVSRPTPSRSFRRYGTRSTFRACWAH